MKKYFNFMYLILFLIFFSCIASECGEDKKGIKQLNSFGIPEYVSSDYVKLLDDKNPEIVYNAICNLNQSAESFAKTLTDTSIKDTSVEKRLAQTAYDKITKFLYSSNEWIVCSSLRFFSEFGSNYKNKDEIVQHLLKVDLKTKSIRLEFINTLKSINQADLKPFDNTLGDYLKARSWLISRYAYQIIPYTGNNEFYTYLLSKYKTASEYDKLLIISSFEHKFNDSILDFIITELKSEQNKKIKLYLVKNLENARNIDKVVSWLNSNSGLLNDIKEPLGNYYINRMDSLSSVRILTVLADKNMIPESAILDSNEMLITTLYITLADKNNKNIQFLKELESALMRNLIFKNKWLDFKIRQEKVNYPEEFIARQQKLINDFRQKSGALYDVYKIDKKLKEDYLKSIKNLESEFSKEINSLNNSR